MTTNSKYSLSLYVQMTFYKYTGYVYNIIYYTVCIFKQHGNVCITYISVHAGCDVRYIVQTFPTKLPSGKVTHQQLHLS